MISVRKAVFLDRDGTLNIEKSYLCDPDQLVLFPDVIPSLQRLIENHFLLFVVTNQSGIGRGYYTEEDMHRVNKRLEAVLRPEGITFQKIYFAPEAPEIPSYGRKPSPQFLLDAAAEFDLNLAHSYMIGDKLSDVECGWNAGVQASILLRTGYGSETERAMNDKRHACIIVDDLTGAVARILGH